VGVGKRRVIGNDVEVFVDESFRVSLRRNFFALKHSGEF
jgi:hypothetical protein